MVLEFREFSKKIKKDTILELDFKVETGEILTIINNKTENLELLKDSFRKRTKFKGEILFDNEDVSKQQLLFTKDFGFYNDLTLIKNLKVALELFNIKVSVDNITEDLEFLNLKPGSKYRDLLPNEINKFHILFSILVDQNVLIIDNTNKDLTVEDMEVVSDFILDKSNNANVIILDTMLNRYNSIADKVLVITDGIKSYYGNLEDLLVLKQLTAINISSNENLETVLSGYQYTIYHENEIVVREEVLEEVVYSLLKNNIEVYQIRNLGEKIKLYEGEADL
ncbi:MAG: ABC transporter ATP-binding protein [Gemella haemolysans]|uniref:ABC transporter ATP-binding protein n=1 Tax=Gemella haemolysans TaxID=1379 RepID=UPI000C8097D4|nr:ABC transporter ATP-binding protein [Gemella haemolysans]MDU6573302.1 ABC transporter ATP-binding protein [Gemella haemolysans]PMC47977.1 ABC transporter ATP-binding protein [Streptococcus sp. UMB1385]